MFFFEMLSFFLLVTKTIFLLSQKNTHFELDAKKSFSVIVLSVKNMRS